MYQSYKCMLAEKIEEKKENKKKKEEEEEGKWNTDLNEQLLQKSNT